MTAVSFLALPRCHKCWSVTGHKVEVFHEPSQQIVAIGRLCDSCFQAALKQADELREDFEALLARGYDREQANAIMIEHIDLRREVATRWTPYP